MNPAVNWQLLKQHMIQSCLRNAKRFFFFNKFISSKGKKSFYLKIYIYEHVMKVLDVPCNVLWKMQMHFQESWSMPAGEGDKFGPQWADPRMEGVGRALERDYTHSTVGSADLPPDSVLWCSSLFWLLPLNSPQMGNGKRPAAWESNQEDHS